MNRWMFLALVCVGMPASASAQSRVVLQLDDALRLAAKGAPEVRVAEAATDVVRAEMVAAELVAAHNPSLVVAAGPRFVGEVSVDLEVGVEQALSLGGRRRAATTVAQMNVDTAGIEADGVRASAMARAATAYFRVVHARRRLRIAQQSVQLGVSMVDTATKRFEAGEIDRLQANTARVALGRHMVDAQVWQGRTDQLLGALRSVLGLDATTELELATVLEQPGLGSLDTLVAAATRRPDLAALAAAAEREAARVELASRYRWPDLALGATYGHEEGAHIAMGIVRVTLPIVAHRQDLAAEATARSAALEREAEARSSTVAIELRAQYQVYETLRAAEVGFRNDVLPVLEENETMTEKAYREGSLDLAELLALRREMIEARESYTDLLLNVALATVRVRALSNTLQPSGETK